MYTAKNTDAAGALKTRELILALQKGYFLNEASEEHRQALLFEELGLSYNMFRVLRYLHTGNESGAEPSELADRLYILRPTMTNTLAHLEKMGYILRENHPSDRRRVIVRLNPEKEEQVIQALDISRDYNERVFACFTPEELEQFISLRNRMAEAREQAVQEILAARREKKAQP